MTMVRIWSLALLAVGMWLLAAYGQHRPAPLGLDAPVTQFSAARADAVLGRVLDRQTPHPAGSSENAAVHGRLLKELAAMGVPAHTQTAMSCFSEPRWGAIECGTVTNIIADVLPGDGNQVLLMAHMDSVAAGPGACDDGCGTATLLETIRALKAQGSQSGHPVTALFTDGEESGILGSAAWLHAPHAPVGAVINMEARGNRGPSFLFQTSPGDARLIDLYAGSVSHYATSSLYAEIYKVLPNDTDFSPFLQAGITGFNFAMVGDVAQYHTALDRRENIEPASLQQHGEGALGLAAALRQSDFAQLKGGNAIYLDVLGLWLPRLPASWALPLSLLAFALIALAGVLGRRQSRDPQRPLVKAAMPLLLLAGCLGMGFLLHAIATWVSGNPDPSFAYPVTLRWSLAFGVFAVALGTARGAGAIACWLWMAALAIVTAALAPGLSPYFLFPSLIAGALLLVTAYGGRTPALMIAAIAGGILWFGLTAGLEAIMGLVMHPLFTVTAAFGFVMLLPLLAPARGAAWGISLAVSLIAALGLAVVAGLQPAYRKAAPQRLNILYLEQGGKAWWLADPFWEKASMAVHLPASLRAAAPFSATPVHLAEMGFAVPTGAARFPAPSATVSRAGDVVTLDLNTSGQAIELMVPRQAGLESVTVGGISRPAPPDRSLAIACGTPDCAHARIVLRLASKAPVSLLLKDVRFGLPEGGARLQMARPAEATTSQGGDRTVVAAAIRVPAP
jgi:hypothetical protein